MARKFPGPQLQPTVGGKNSLDSLGLKGFCDANIVLVYQIKGEGLQLQGTGSLVPKRTMYSNSKGFGQGCWHSRAR